MCTIKEKYCISDEFSGFCGQFVEKLGWKDPPEFLSEGRYMFHITYLKIRKSFGVIFLLCDLLLQKT